MLKTHREILKQLRENIVNEIDVHNHILQALKTPYILNEEHIKQIDAGSTNKEKAEILLDILPTRGAYAFQYFHQALRLQYGWISDTIDKLLEPLGSSSNKSECLQTNIPSISPLTVEREEKAKELKSALKSLIPKGYVVLHGMKGYGKSCLTVNVLNDPRLVSNLFDNQIYWLEFGKHRPLNEDIAIQMSNLYHQITQTQYKLEPPTHEKETLRMFIQNHFRHNAHKNALLVLDDVHNKKIIDEFSFDCKILVITTDISVLQNKHSLNIEMKDGFTKMETLRLFAQVLNVEVDKLPREASMIHDECKGMPLLITMLATQFNIFKQSMQHDNPRWKYYLNSLKTKNRRNNVIGEYLEKQETIFKMALEELEGDMKERFLLLAIFNGDVNIMPKTLEILWDEEDSYLVEDVMLEYFNKSLVVKQWNVELNSYIYGVHERMLEYLCKIIPTDELIAMHRSFVEKYRKFGDGSLKKLPDDNYSYTYIGHHLEEAQMFDEFPELYLNFDFLQAKIYHSGLNDIYLDLVKYRSYITKDGDPELESRVNDLELFLKENARILVRQRDGEYLDLVQIAMNHSVEGYMKQTARQLARQKTSNLYLSLERKMNHPDAPLSEEVPINVTVARFTDNQDEILLGGEKGSLMLWNCSTRSSKYFYGHSKESTIKKILISQNCTHFLSLSHDGVVKLFEIEGQDYLSPSSPRQRQSNWYSFFNEEDDSKMSISMEKDLITDVSFGYSDSIIVTCNYSGLIEIWKMDGVKIFKEHSTLTESEKKIATTNKRRLLHILNLKEGILEVYSWRDDQYTYSSLFNIVQQNNMKVVYMIEYDESVHGSTMIIVTQDNVCFVRWYFNDGQIHTYDVKNQECESDKLQDNGKVVVYTCAALTYDEKYLILADSDGNISVREACALFNLIITYKAHVSSLDTYYLDTENAHLIIGSSKRIVHMWKLDANQDSAVMTKPSVYVIMKDGDNEDIVVSETIIGSIVVWSNERMLYEIPKVDGKIAKLFYIESEKIIYYTEEKKNVTVIDCKTRAQQIIFPVSEIDTFITVIEIDNRNVVICQENKVDIKIWIEEERPSRYRREILEPDQGIQTFIKNVGPIFKLFKLSDNHLLLVTNDGKIKFWYVKRTTWKETGTYNTEMGSSKVTYCCLSNEQNCLSIVFDYQKVMVYFIDIDSSQTDSYYKYYVSDKMDVFTISFDYESNRMDQIKCCAFSYDLKYVAVGMDTGLISVVDLTGRSEPKELNYHKKAIEQLVWAPSNIGLPIFLSLTNTEMVFWNISLSKFKRTTQRQSRMGSISSSNSSPNVSISPRSSLILSNSRSVDFSKLSLSLSDSNADELSFNGNSSNSGKIFWLAKTGRISKHPELLGVVPLPTISNTKVCISGDFSKFMTIDVHGSMTKYRLFEK